MKVATKLSSAFGLLVTLLVIMLAYQVLTMRRAVSTGYELSEIFARLEISVARQLDDLNRLEEAASKYWITRDPRYRFTMEETLAAFDSTLIDLAGASLADRERVEVERLRGLWGDFPATAARFQAAVAANDERRATAELDHVLEHLETLQGGARRLADASRDAIRARLERSSDAALAAERVSFAIALAALVLSILVAAWIVRSIADSLRRLQAGTRQVADGNFDYRLAPQREDEFARLARDFNRMTERLAELDGAKRDFLSNVSHDLKTPLASMQETSRVLLDEVAGELTPKQRRLLELNNQCGERLSGMIGKILDLSAMEAGGVPFEVRPHDLLALVGQAVEIAGPAAGEARLQIATDLPEAPVPLSCDGDRILRVLDNLLENAIKFSPEGSTIRVDLRRVTARPDGLTPRRWRKVAPQGEAGSVALLTVTDSGPGIAAEEKEKIFERFYQGARAGRARNRGVGLGLAICREIVDAHGGELWVQDGPDGGSAFFLALPGAIAGTGEPLLATAEGAR